jgi:sigma-B regulation protein RsbU (phosphoserine phosphatase)
MMDRIAGGETLASRVRERFGGLRMIVQDAVSRRQSLVQERRRVAVVHGLGQLDTPPQERFDRITRIALSLFQVPVAEINLVDASRQFTKSPQLQGQPLSASRRDSFCDLTVQQQGILVVRDATTDARFSWKSTVTGERQLRFYAGVPLQVAGHRVGTLCLADTAPRDFTEEDRALLARLARWTEAELLHQNGRAAR